MMEIFDWFFNTATGLTAVLGILLCFFAGVWAWKRMDGHIDHSGYVDTPHGPFGLLNKKVPLTSLSREDLEALIKSYEDAQSPVPQLLLDARDGKLAEMSASQDEKSAVKELPKAPEPEAYVDDRIAKMLGIAADLREESAPDAIQGEPEGTVSPPAQATAEASSHETEEPPQAEAKVKPRTKCKICGNPVYCRGLCQTHYVAQRNKIRKAAKAKEAKG